jgi:hypothetical protein
MVRQTRHKIILGLFLFVSTNLFCQTQTDSIEDHLYKLYKSADNKAVIDYALKVEKDHPKIANEIHTDYFIVRSAISIDNNTLADKYADKVLKKKYNDYAELHRTDVCLKMANYYHDKSNYEKEIYWLKLRLYKWTLEKCGVGKKQRNIDFYERLIFCYDKIGDTKNKDNFQKKLDKYKANDDDAWKTP